MYNGEDIILDLRLNYLNNFIHKFIIVESEFNHRGERKKLLFDINKFIKFKDKIIYLVLDHQPDGLLTINENDNEGVLSDKYILNGMKRDFYQRNYILKGLEEAEMEDLILISDLDEIPNLNNLNLNTVSSRVILFQQKMCYYKFNLYLPSFIWVGTKGCKKKNLISPQWLRDIKDRSYPIWRLDILFSKNKYYNLNIIKDGGWHFSYLDTPSNIEKKLKTYAHHREYDLNPIGTDNISKMISEKKAIYNLKVDMKSSKFDHGPSLEKINLEDLPKYLISNKEKYKDWIE